MTSTDHQKNFIIVGAMKCGTTALYRYLRSVIGDDLSEAKELHYFDWNFRQELNWYFNQLGNGHIVGEASPFYLYHPWVPERIRKTLPDSRLIILLRCPVARAISHYFHSKLLKHETQTIIDAFGFERTRLAGFDKKEDFDCLGGLGPQVWYSYTSRGRYAEQLERYLDRFPSENIMIIESELLFSNPLSVLPKVHEFLELDQKCREEFFFPMNLGVGDKSLVPRNLTLELFELFEPEIQKLQDLLNREFSWQKNRELRSDLHSR